MQVRTVILYLAIIPLLMISCNKSMQKEEEVVAEMSNVAPSSSTPPPPPGEDNSASPASEAREQSQLVDKKKIIKDGSIKLEVDNVLSAKKGIEAVVKKFNGYVAQETYTDNEFSTTYHLIVRIPASGFEIFLNEIEKGNKNIVYKDISSRDVTEEYFDLQTRLNNKKSYLNRYTELLKQAKTVEEILKIQENMRVLEEEIETTEGRLKYLNDQVTYSKLVIEISYPKEFLNQSFRKGGFFKQLGQSLTNGWYSGVELLLFFFRIWPFLIVTIVVYYFARMITRRKKKTSQKPGQP